jgi:uncharacterized membrane protein YfcA
MISGTELALLAAVLLAGMIVQRITGMGSNLVIAPYLILLIGPVAGVVVVNIVGVITAAMCFIQLRRHVEWRTLAWLLVGAAVGAFPGLAVVVWTPKELLTPLIGILLLAGLLAVRVMPRTPGMNSGSVRLSLLFGMAAGLVNVVSGAGGLPIAVFALVTDWDQLRFSGTFQPFFVIVGSMSAVISLSWAGSSIPALPAEFWLQTTCFLALGVVLGGIVARRLPASAARHGMVAVSAAGAATLILSSVF